MGRLEFIDPTHRERQRRDGWGTRTLYANPSRCIDLFMRVRYPALEGRVMSTGLSENPAIAIHPAARPGDRDLVRGRFGLGEFELTLCTDGTYLLDGGAMFGVVPKTMWSKRIPADEQNRILLG